MYSKLSKIALFVMLLYVQLYNKNIPLGLMAFLRLDRTMQDIVGKLVPGILEGKVNVLK